MPQGRDGQTAARNFARSRPRLHRRRARRLARRARGRRPDREPRRTGRRLPDRIPRRLLQGRRPAPRRARLQPVHERPRAGLQAQGDAGRRRHHAAQPRPARALAEPAPTAAACPIWFTEFAWRTAPTPKLGTISPGEAGRPPAQDRHARAHALPVREAARLVPRARRVAHRATGARAWPPSTGSRSPPTGSTRCSPESDGRRAAGDRRSIRCYGGIDAPPRAGPARPHGRSARREPEAHRRRLCRRRPGGRRAGARARARDLRLPARGSPVAPRVPARLPGARRSGSPARSRCRSWSAARGSTATACATRRSCSPAARSSARYDKRELPNYGVFDEERTFSPGRGALHIEAPGGALALTVCEDVWLPDAVAEAAALGARLRAQHLGVAVPPRQGPGARGDAATRARDGLCAVAYCNLVGGQDELVFDGRSAVFGPDGEVLARAASFEEELLVCDLDLAASPCTRGCATRGCAAGAAHRAAPARDDRARARAASGRRSRSSVAPPPAGQTAELWGALRLGLRRLRAQERLRARAARPLGRHRLGARGGAGRRRARRRPRRGRLDADALQQRGHAQRCPPRRPSGSASRSASSRSRSCGSPSRARCPARAAWRPRTCRRASAACC